MPKKFPFQAFYTKTIFNRCKTDVWLHPIYVQQFGITTIDIKSEDLKFERFSRS